MQTSLRTAKKSLQQGKPVYIGEIPTSPIGGLWVAVTDLGLAMVEWEMPQADFIHLVESRLHQKVVLDGSQTAQAIQQIAAYLAGNLREFSLPLDLTSSTPFQQEVLRITAQIPYGKTMTYGEIATLCGKPNAARAVGRVEATNPIPLVIPCHRVVGTDGELHGYGGPGGIKLKNWLLQLERTGN